MTRAGPPNAGAVQGSIERHYLTDDVARHLERLITTGRLEDGQRLPPEPQLATDFGVSRTVVREALHFLEQAMLRLMVRLRDGRPAVWPEAIVAHRAVLDAVGAGDATGAAEAMARHLDRVALELGGSP